MLRRRSLILVSLGLGCGPSIEWLEEDVAGSTGSPSDPADPVTSETTAPPPSPPGTSTTGANASTSGLDTDDATTGSQFIEPPEDTCVSYGDEAGRCSRCSLFTHQCPMGEKCMPWANDGGTSWNALRCSPVAESPRQVGEPCTVLGSEVSGLDDCDLGLMCWGVDSDTLEGHCVELCRGSPRLPECGPATSCLLANEGAIALCLPECDPLGDDCEPEAACIPSEDGFVCTPGSTNATAGEPCERFDTCGPGLVCSDSETVGPCDPEIPGCCTPWCDLSAPDPSAGCFDPAQECVSWWEGTPPPSFEVLGVCVVPPP